jgi:hypothetical protein
MTQVRKCAHDAIIAPLGSFGHLHHQLFHFLVDSGLAWRAAVLGAIELLGDKFAKPAQDGVRLACAGGDLFQAFLAQPMANLAESAAFVVG